MVNSIWDVGKLMGCGVTDDKRGLDGVLKL